MNLFLKNKKNVFFFRFHFHPVAFKMQKNNRSRIRHKYVWKKIEIYNCNLFKFFDDFFFRNMTLWVLTMNCKQNEEFVEKNYVMKSLFKLMQLLLTFDDLNK